MRRTVLSASLLLAGLAHAADADGCRDHPLVSRVPGYELAECPAADYDEYLFATAKEEVRVGGRKTVLTYRLGAGPARSSAFVGKNYVAALQKVGFKVESPQQSADNVVLSAKRPGAETWLHVAGYVGEGDPVNTHAYVVTLVEKAAMQQVVSAKELADELQRTGRAVLAVQFDTGKDTVKPESEPLVKAMAELLKASPSLKVLIVGHTDLQGDLDANLKLSQARASSLQKALVGQHGIAAGRLSAHGVGPLSPVATNDTEAGRAQNRRVELVKR